MTSLKIDFAEKASADMMLTPIFDKKQKCIGGLLYDAKKPEEKKFISVKEMIPMVKSYTQLLSFAKKDSFPRVFDRIYAFRIMLGDCVLAYQVYESQGMMGLVYKKTMSCDDFVSKYGYTEYEDCE